MYLAQLDFEKIRSFSEPTSITFSKGINLLIGENNAGKSTILNIIQTLQVGVIGPSHISIEAQSANWLLVLKDLDDHFFGRIPRPSGFSASDAGGARYSCVLNKKEMQHHIQLFIRSQWGNIGGPIPIFENKEPNNWIYPYLSNRRTTGYNDQISADAPNAVTGTHHNLAAKIDRVNDPEYHAHGEFRTACKEILGFHISALASQSGKHPGFIAKRGQNILIDDMGSGVPHVVGLVADLCESDGNLYLIEEIENDIHPRALKRLLDFIIKKSKNNQIIISTHSNIVTNYLGAVENSKIFHVYKMFEGGLQKSRIVEKTGTTQSRTEVLEQIGYELFDANLWSGWLFLEESSAERIINQFLIPWFAPKLIGRLRTFSTKGISSARKKVDLFINLTTFIDMQPIYKNRAWVFVDDGEQGRKVIGDIKDLYCKGESDWKEENFRAFSQSDFEYFYPEEFQSEVREVLSLTGDKKRERKNELLEKVVLWLKEDENRKSNLERSAAEVITMLKGIEAVLYK